MLTSIDTNKNKIPTCLVDVVNDDVVNDDVVVVVGAFQMSQKLRKFIPLMVLALKRSRRH